MSTSRIIKSLRELHDLNQEEMAQKLGISKPAYFKKENGITEFTISEAKNLAEIFGKTVEEIFFAKEVS